jgi:hypothetical protein
VAVLKVSGQSGAFNSAIYVLECRDSGGAVYFKVGKANNPHDRISTLVCGLPLEVTRVRFVNIAMDSRALAVERELHKYFERYAVRGEWFSIPNDDAYGQDMFSFGLAGQLDCCLCKGTWHFQEIDWPAYEASKTAKVRGHMERKREAAKGKLRRSEAHRLSQLGV